MSTNVTYAYPTAANWTRGRCRETVESYRHDFESDDLLHEEQDAIRRALVDTTWPASWGDYVQFCLTVLGHIPGTADE